MIRRRRILRQHACARAKNDRSKNARENTRPARQCIHGGLPFQLEHWPGILPQGQLLRQPPSHRPVLASAVAQIEPYPGSSVSDIRDPQCKYLGRSRISLTLNAGYDEKSPPRTRERMLPAEHARLGVLDVLLGKEVLRSHLVDRIDRAQEVALVAERHCRIDAHAAFELGVRRSPLLLACGHAL